MSNVSAFAIPLTEIIEKITGKEGSDKELQAFKEGLAQTIESSDRVVGTIAATIGAVCRVAIKQSTTDTEEIAKLMSYASTCLMARAQTLDTALDIMGEMTIHELEVYTQWRKQYEEKPNTLNNALKEAIENAFKKTKEEEATTA